MTHSFDKSLYAHAFILPLYLPYTYRRPIYYSLSTSNSPHDGPHSAPHSAALHAWRHGGSATYMVATFGFFYLSAFLGPWRVIGLRVLQASSFIYSSHNRVRLLGIACSSTIAIAAWGAGLNKAFLPIFRYFKADRFSQRPSFSDLYFLFTCFHVTLLGRRRSKEEEALSPNNKRGECSRSIIASGCG